MATAVTQSSSCGGSSEDRSARHTFQVVPSTMRYILSEGVRDQVQRKCIDTVDSDCGCTYELYGTIRDIAGSQCHSADYSQLEFGSLNL